MKDETGKTGEAIRLATTEQRMFGQTGIWQVASGHVNLFIAISDEYGLAGPPRYVGTLRTGQILYGASERDATSGLTATLMAVAAEATRIERCASPDADSASEWALMLCRDLTALATETPAQSSEQMATVTAPPDGLFRARNRDLALVTLTEGSARLAGQAGADLVPADGAVALNNAAWLKAGPDGAKAEIPAADDTPEALPEAARGTTRLWLSAVFGTIRAERAAESTRLARAEMRRAGQQARAVDHLSFAGTAAKPLEPRPDDPLVSAFEVIGREIEVTFDTVALNDEARSLPQRVFTAAEISGARARKVDLNCDWMKGDAGVLLAFTEAGLPRVFIPRMRAFNMGVRWERIAPETGDLREATPADLDELVETGFSFIVAIPEVLNDKDEVDFWKLSMFTLRPQMRDMRMVMLLSVVSMALGMLTPMAHFVIVDKVIPNDERELLVGIGIMTAALTLSTFIFGMANAFVNLRVQTKLFQRMQSAIIDRMLRLPNRFFRAWPTGELLKRALMITDVSVGMMSTMSTAISSVIGLVLMLGLCFYYSTKLAFLALVTALASSALTVASSYVMRPRNIRMQLVGGRNLGFLMQIIQGVSKLQTARAEDRAFAGWAEGKGEVLRMAYANARVEFNAGLIGNFISTASNIALFYIAGVLVFKTQVEQALNPLATPLLTIGVFFAFQRAFNSVTGMTQQFFNSFVAAHEQVLKRELVKPFLETPLERQRNRLDPGQLRGQVELRQVSFKYSDDGPQILDGLNIEALDGEFVALVGPSGAGKSTIAALLLGFETPQTGAVFIDGKNIETLEMSAVRRQIGVVLQSDRIPGGSIYNAIAGASSISVDQAWLAARDAGLEDDIRAMPMGMYSLLPEGGGTLSGGQRQRLSIARALAQEPRIVLFDEATSALDNRSQEIVSESLRRRRVTRIVIAHRLSTIAGADRVFVLERGRVVETGTPDELRAADGLFARLARAQEA